MSWTTPALAVTNTVITASFWNTNLRDDENFLFTNIWYKLSSLTGTGINFTSISGSYSNLKFVGMLRSTKVATIDDFFIRINNISTGVYNWIYLDIDGNLNVTEIDNVNDNIIKVTNGVSAASAPANEYSSIEVLIYKYSSTSINKEIAIRTSVVKANAALTDIHMYRGIGLYKQTTAVTRVDFTNITTYEASSYLTMYGMI